jgi:hypothetical protein
MKHGEPEQEAIALRTLRKHWDDLLRLLARSVAQRLKAKQTSQEVDPCGDVASANTDTVSDDLSCS